MLRRVTVGGVSRNAPTNIRPVKEVGAHFLGIVNESCSARYITSRGQFNPIHDFSYALEHGNIKARNEKEFSAMISNPGPIRICYSADYLDWLYQAYKSKVENKERQNAVERKFHGQVISQGANTKFWDHNRPFMRLQNSIRRTAAERLRQEAQYTLDHSLLQQGLWDVFERQPQFPVIHLNLAERFHIVELFKEIILEKALEPYEIWDKALLYRAVLSERRNSYPKSFSYIFEAVDGTAFSPTPPQDNSAFGAADSNSSVGNFLKSPQESAYLYFLYLVRKYFIENAVESHVILRCHRDSNRDKLLFSVPPPKDDKEVKESIKREYKDSFAGLNAAVSSSSIQDSFQEPGGGASRGSNHQGGRTSDHSIFTPPLPSSYPPIQALWKCEVNFPLLLLLVFGELNLMVSDNPFAKFPNAFSFLTRPYSTVADSEENLSGGLLSQGDSGGGRSGGRSGTDAVSLALIIAEKRGKLLANFPRTLQSSIDARGKDLQRLRQRFHREDLLGFQKLLRNSSSDQGEKGGNYASFSDWAYFNPRALRAEERDRVQRTALDALKDYERAKKDIYRSSYDDAEQSRCERPTQMKHTVPTFVPSLPHFLSIIRRDPHISFLMNVYLDGPKQQQLEKRCYHLASALYRTSLEFHKEGARRIHRQKVQVAAVLLDNFVWEQWGALVSEGSNAFSTDEGGPSLTTLARGIGGNYEPFEKRALDESGFLTDARMEDYSRWMAPPAVRTD